MPSARKLTATPPTIWSARRWIAKKAWTSASRPPESIAIPTPQTQLPVLSAPQMPQKAPISIIPSRPMFTTPERSEKMPPSAAKVSGVAKTSIDAIRLAVKTVFRLPTLDCIARSESPQPTIPAAIAPQPTRPPPRVTATMPHSTATIPSRIGHCGERAVIGGIARMKATTPMTIPTVPTVEELVSRERAAVPTYVLIGLPLERFVEGSGVDRLESSSQARRVASSCRALRGGGGGLTPAPLELPPRVPHGQDQHVCPDEEHDEPLDHLGQMAREARVDRARLQAVRRAVEQGAEQEAGQSDADGRVPPEQRN